MPLTIGGAGVPVVYHLAGDHKHAEVGGGDITINPKTNNDTLITEGLLLRLTDCDTLDEIRVISLRNKELSSCLRMLS